ncbi:hypothetical protein JHK87_002445 [Glycine soja]|nr:hypothetical protein JHK87_002445 [Glycine soja]KAG5089836.1 hypothetical protein JHK86_002448 [Glycine max]
MAKCQQTTKIIRTKLRKASHGYRTFVCMAAVTIHKSTVRPSTLPIHHCPSPIIIQHVSDLSANKLRLIFLLPFSL